MVPWVGKGALTLEQSDLGGSTFTFYIGPNRSPFVVHVKLFQKVSKPLGSMMTNGKMNESLTKSASLLDVDEETFGSFCQFAYTGTYVLPSLGGQEATMQESGPPPAKGNNRCSRCKTEPLSKIDNKRYCSSCLFITTGLHSGFRHSGSSVKRKYSVSAADQFAFQQLAVGQCSGDEVRDYLDAATPADREDHAMMSHAKIFVLADRYMVPILRELALHKLHRVLDFFRLSDTNIQEVVGLVRYTLANTTSSDANPPVNRELRKLVFEYAMSRGEALVNFPPFVELLKDEIEFVTYFAISLARRLAYEPAVEV